MRAPQEARRDQKPADSAATMRTTGAVLSPLLIALFAAAALQGCKGGSSDEAAAPAPAPAPVTAPAPAPEPPPPPPPAPPPPAPAPPPPAPAPAPKPKPKPPAVVHPAPPPPVYQVPPPQVIVVPGPPVVAKPAPAPEPPSAYDKAHRGTITGIKTLYRNVRPSEAPAEVDPKDTNRVIVGYRITVKLDNGKSRDFEQPTLRDMRIGHHVTVEDGKLHRR